MLAGRSRLMIVGVVSTLIAGCAGAATEGMLGLPASADMPTSSVTVPTPVVLASAPGAAPVQPAAAVAVKPAPQAVAQNAQRPAKDDRLRMPSGKRITPGAMQQDGSYQLSADELAMDCKRLTGRSTVRILQIRDYQFSEKSSAVSRGAKQVVSPVFGGSAYGADPDADYLRDRAILVAYNKRLAEKGCRVFDLEKELQPKPTSETPTPVKQKR